MNQDTMYKLEEMCCKEIDKIVQRGELTASTLEQAAMLVDTVKDIYTIEAMEDSDEYSQDGRSYDGGGSYANRTGTHYVRGHYSRDDGGSYNGGRSYGRDSRGRYSRDGEKQDMIHRLEKMMNQSDDPNEVESYRRALDQLHNA